ncbi:capsid cement protein [Bordetella bronchiseptica]|uniref:Phage-related putative exported protein n=1 Tax=Bordetella bronchiseptica (strain ATCC BAA-588 / NCTC 13252 / RB50) TaxID=257310 RepID=A0A0H3LSA1_BORBR|nr:capsid cement protein [Bordetella bronchiseptica]KAK64350.1 hypothetical protein AZ22_3665 [Bordetella bronchiseptica 980-2]KDD64610.1 hypothetical protein L533_3838 [Bordetella bronchiseptica OSU553]AMG89708.1 DUF2190 domain-containing protein [Bordetella bronchiseptica]KCV51068.1 hypothetical protein L491_3706 [Bordetella bronchiseptica 3E44]KCV61614.1 hypothetical protein AZ14_3786 [Bordetella bronchiseptica 980]
MSQKTSILTLSLVAAASISADTFVTLAGEPAAAGEAAIGIAIAPAAAGEYFPYDVLGTSTAKAGAAITKGQNLEVGAGATAVPQTAGVVVAIALEDAEADETVEVLLIQGGTAPASGGA